MLSRCATDGRPTWPPIRTTSHTQVPPDNPAKQPPGAHLRWLASALSGKYFQQHAPIRQQTVPVGHAVRFGYLQTAIAMLHAPRAMPACSRAGRRPGSAW